MVDYQRRGTDLPLAGDKMGGSSKDNDVAAKYAEELVSLRMNSKPLINSLTMMAEDYMKQAPIVVQTIESHLARADPNSKLPVLYLIDSIIKNVKRDYITLFAENIVTSFCRVFERVRADEKTRLQMWKVRQTWTAIFPTNKLYQIDVKARSMDPGWPLAKLPNTSIHVNPKFLHIKSKTKSTDSPSTSPKSTDERTSPSTVGGEDDEVRMREELLIKQKKLIELQQKKLELELMQTQARIAEAERLKASKGKDSEDKEKLLKQAEIAKQRTNMATSIMAKASTKKQKESRRSVSPAASDKTSKSSSSSTSTTTSSKTTATIVEAEITDPRLSKTRVAHIKSEKVSPKKDEKKSPKKHSSPSGSSTSSKNELKIEKVKDEPQTSKSELNDNKDKDRKRSKSKADDSSRSQSREKSQHGQHHDSPDRVSKHRDSSREKSRTKSDSSSSPEKSDRSGKRGGSSSGREREHSHSSSSSRSSERERSKDRIETDSSSVKSSSPRKSNVEDKESLNNRRSAVLSKSYRKRQEPGEKDRQIKTEPSTSGDTDLRFSNLQDVDLRREGTDGVNEPSPKKSRLSAKSAIIEDLFGEEDVDLRQASGGGSNWAQVKKRDEEEQSKSTKPEEMDEEVRHILSDVGNRPPPGISPANSIDSNMSACDNLGRPLLFSRLSVKPEDRKRELDTRSMSIDAVEQFCARHLERPGGPTENDIKIAIAQATAEFNSGSLNSEQHTSILQELVRLGEVNKIRQVQESRNASAALLNMPSPWGANNVWAVDARGNFLPRTGDLTGGVRFPGPWAISAMNQWQQSSLPAPAGPNPFVEAAVIQAAAAAPPEDLIPEANRLELEMALKNSNAKMPLDKVIRHVRFYGETTIVFLGQLHDEPRTISFQQSRVPITIYINRSPFKCCIGETKPFYLDKEKHTIKIGTPKRELIIDREPHEVSFTGQPIRVRLSGKWNFFALEGPPPQVEIGKKPRHDLVAGRVTLYVNSNPNTIYLDEMPQVLDLDDATVIFRFCNNFRSFSLNGRIFPANFGSQQPMSVTLRNRQHFLRLAGISRLTDSAMKSYVRMKMGDDLSGGLGRGGRRGGGRHGFQSRANEFEGSFSPGDTSHIEENPLDMLATQFPTETKETGNQNNAYKSDEVTGTDSSIGNAGSLNMQDLLSKLMKAGLLPTGEKKDSEKPDEVHCETSEPDAESSMGMDTSEHQAPEKPVVAGPPPLEVVDISLSDNLREKRVKLIDQICTGTQCASCGLRFPPDQSLRYTQHLDWHFRLNRREKSHSRKAQSRRWYYDLSDWIQFEEIEDLEERAASLFEFQEPDKAEGEEAETSTLLNPDAYTVLASGYDGASCPQCGEGFETFYEGEEEEWRIRDALTEKDPPPGEKPRLFHPICHEDYVAALARQENESMETEDSVAEAIESAEAGPVPIPAELDVTDSSKHEDDEDEVLILKEGKKEVVLMEIALEEDDPIVNSSTNEGKSDETEKITIDNENETEKDNDLNSTLVNNNKPNLSPIVIQVEDDIPGITSTQGGGGVFDFALSSNQQRADKEQELPPITYNSMQFDFPKIKVEPPEWDALDENQVIMSSEFLVNENQSPMDITLDDDDSPPPMQKDESANFLRNVDIDLTADDDDNSQHAPSHSLQTAIDGNLEMRSESKVSLLSVPTKIRINISQDKVAESHSPSHPGSSQENKSPSSADADADSHKISIDSAHNEKVLEEIKRLKPRLVGKKLVNCPPKKTGTEESGLCVIC